MTVVFCFLFEQLFCCICYISGSEDHSIGSYAMIQASDLCRSSHCNYISIIYYFSHTP